MVVGYVLARGDGWFCCWGCCLAAEMARRWIGDCRRDYGSWEVWRMSVVDAFKPCADYDWNCKKKWQLLQVCVLSCEAGVVVQLRNCSGRTLVVCFWGTGGWIGCCSQMAMGFTRSCRRNERASAICGYTVEAVSEDGEALSTSWSRWRMNDYESCRELGCSWCWEWDGGREVTEVMSCSCEEWWLDWSWLLHHYGATQILACAMALAFATMA